jgi:alpha-beta hydrolase superfamily lysophospholipase
MSSPCYARLGIYGHSFGDANAALALQNDTSPYLGGAALDAPFYGSLVTKGFHRPWWYMAAMNSGNHDLLVAEWLKTEKWKKSHSSGGVNAS